MVCNYAAVGSQVGRSQAAAAAGGLGRAAVAVGRRRAGRSVWIGNDLAKINFLLKNKVLGQFGAWSVIRPRSGRR